MKTISGAVTPGGITLIDAHHHLWDLSMDRHPWLGSRPERQFFLGDYSPIKKNYLPADYLKDSAGHNVLATVHCEAEWDRADQVGLNALKKANVKIVRADPALMAEVQKRSGPIIEDWIKRAEAKHKGIKAKAALEEFRAELKKVAAGK